MPARAARMGFGSNPRLPLDQAYLQFLQQIADDVGAAIDRGESARARARAFEERDNLLRQALRYRHPVGPRADLHPGQPAVLPPPTAARTTDRQDLPRGALELADTPLPGILQQVYRTGERQGQPREPDPAGPSTAR